MMPAEGFYSSSLKCFLRDVLMKRLYVCIIISCLLLRNHGFTVPNKHNIGLRPKKMNQFMTVTVRPSMPIISPLQIPINEFFENMTWTGVGTSKDDIALMKRELSTMNQRLIKIESNIASGTRVKSPVDSFLDSLTVGTMALNAKTVEVCAAIGFFAIGTVVGASIFDRLWLLSGLLSAWWALGAVHQDSTGGTIARKVGVQLAQLIRDIQEKYNQAVIFYRTGKLAYVSSKIWDQYDKEWAITERFDELKRLAMRRATEFNTAFQEQQVGERFADIWRVIVAAPSEAQRWDQEHGISSTIVAFGKGLWTTTTENIGKVVKRGTGEHWGEDNDGGGRQKKEKKFSGGDGELAFMWGVPLSVYRSVNSVGAEDRKFRPFSFLRRKSMKAEDSSHAKLRATSKTVALRSDSGRSSGAGGAGEYHENQGNSWSWWDPHSFSYRNLRRSKSRNPWEGPFVTLWAKKKKAVPWYKVPMVQLKRLVSGLDDPEEDERLRRKKWSASGAGW